MPTDGEIIERTVLDFQRVQAHIKKRKEKMQQT